MPADFRLYVALNSGTNAGFSIQIGANFLLIGNIQKDNSNTDSYICINTKTNLIEGCNASYQSTGNLYNSYIVRGDFFKIPKASGNPLTYDILITSTANSGRINKIEYDYLYY